MVEHPPTSRYIDRLRRLLKRASNVLRLPLNNPNRAVSLYSLANQLHQAACDGEWHRTCERAQPVLPPRPGDELYELIALEGKAEEMRDLCTSAARLLGDADD